MKTRLTIIQGMTLTAMFTGVTTLCSRGLQVSVFAVFLQLEQQQLIQREL